MDTWLKKLQNLLSLSPKRKQKLTHSQTRRSVDLIKNRPLSLQEKYHISTNDQIIDDVFMRLRTYLVDTVDTINKQYRTPLVVFKEAGRFTDGRPYLFFKPANQRGWLIERQGAGWIVTRAEKIIDRSLFLRGSQDVWDQVVLYNSEQATTPRITSRQFGGDLLALSLYEKRFADALSEKIVNTIE